jgi:glycosyltransferase involved in cell wall biosynthesis
MFSVIVPVYNHARFVAQAIHSALRSPLVGEVLLVDDGSQDGSASVAARLAATSSGRVRDLTVKGDSNRGAHYRLNQLAAAATCEWIAVLNSDDVFVNGRFEALASDPGFGRADFAFGHLLFINQLGELIGAKRGPDDPGVPFPECFQVSQMIDGGNLLDLLAHQNYLGSSSNMVFRKSLHSRIGGFAAYRYIHDWDFALRAMILGEPLYVRRFLTAYRMHPGNTISESQRGVDAEAAAAFTRLLSDFPELTKRPEFARALQPNANGVSILSISPELSNTGGAVGVSVP